MRYRSIIRAFSIPGGVLSLALLGAIGAGSVPAGGASAEPAADAGSPLACAPAALSPAERTRHFDELGPKLRSLRKSVRELPDGYAFEYAGDPATYRLVAEWAAGERVCCPFFDIDIRSEREGGPVWVRVTGRDGVKKFMEIEGAEWIRK
jgi:hypothetical protein